MCTESSRSSSGFTLIEAVVSLTVLGIITAATATGVAQTVRMQRAAERQTLMLTQAAAAINVVSDIVQRSPQTAECISNGSCSWQSDRGATRFVLSHSQESGVLSLDGSPILGNVSAFSVQNTAGTDGAFLYRIALTLEAEDLPVRTFEALVVPLRRIGAAHPAKGDVL